LLLPYLSRNAREKSSKYHASKEKRIRTKKEKEKKPKESKLSHILQMAITPPN